ncbi:MAG: FtsX-like permease family protein [Bdellovibrionaceae bacterium]|nr:FtsX-like permease family protein [Pseudobdellovibrionaceae bacterium]
MSFYILWLKRVLFSAKTVFQFSSLFSLFGLILAVASLTVAVLVVNGFSSGLEKTIVDKQGHLRIQSEADVLKEDLLELTEDYEDFFEQKVFFLFFEALLIKDQLFKGVFFEAIEDEKLKLFSFFKNRMLEGNLDFSSPSIILGSELAKELRLSSGSKASIVISQAENFLRKQAQFKVAGIIDFGRYEFNSFFAVMPLSSSKFLGFDKVSGMSLWLKDKKKVDVLKKELSQILPPYYSVQSWRDVDKAFFEIIESDKKIIFLVLFILIISAGFNVSSALFIQVFKRAKEINILKAMGLKKTAVRNLFLLNGFILGIFGSFFGLILGLLVFALLIFLQSQWDFIPAQSYQINEIAWAWSFSDILQIFLISLFVIVLSSVFPAIRAYKMNVKRGLSYD